MHLPNHDKADAVLVSILQVCSKGALNAAQDYDDLSLGPAPILRAEAVEGHCANAQGLQ